jgi:hypothetical protein
MFSMDNTLKITQVASILGLLLTEKNITQQFGRKNGLGYALGGFFTTPPGHPV